MPWQLLSFVAAFTLSLGLSLYLTPVVRRGALRFGVLDAPDGVLKQQSTATPYLGGIAIYLAFLCTLAMIFDFEPRLLALLLSGTMLAMLGLFDDLRAMPPRLKLLGQCMAVWVLVKAGISIQIAAISPWLALPLSIFWLVGITNALNIIDVSDGLASGVAAIAATALFVIAVVSGDILIGTTTLALVGSVIGFLRYNQPPALIYLGDAGSMFIGFMLAALAMIGSYDRGSALGVLAPVLILIVPIFDTTLVVLARLLKGQSPFRGSPDHFAIRLKHHGWSTRRVAYFSYSIGVTGAVAGVTLTMVQKPAAIAVLLVCACLVSVLSWWIWRLKPLEQSAARGLEANGLGSEEQAS